MQSLAEPAGDVDVLDEVYELMLLAKKGLEQLKIQHIRHFYEPMDLFTKYCYEMTFLCDIAITLIGVTH